tara:strand:+ start:928 stop:1275 length:348 start_codon:yes stop_codon:yes gene_type:complete
MYEFVKIGDKTYPVKFGFNALRHFSKMTGIAIQDFSKIGVNMTFDTALTLIYVGLMDGSRAAKEEFHLTIDDLADLLDTDMEAIERCMVLFTEMMTPKQNKALKSQSKGKGKGKK